MSLPPPTPRQARIIWLALSGLAIAVLIGLVVGLVWGLGKVLAILSPVLWPLAVAGVIAYLLDPVVDYVEVKLKSRARAIMAVFGLALLVVGVVFGSTLPQIITETRQLAARVPQIAATIEQRVEVWITQPPPWMQPFLKGRTGAPAAPAAVPAGSDVTAAGDTNAPAPVIEPGKGGTPPPVLDRETLKSATDWLAGFLPKAGRWVFGQVGRVTAWFGVLVGLGLVPLYAFYLLLEKRGIESKWTDYLPVTDSEFKNELVFVLRSINEYMITFFRGQVLVAICDSILYTIGFLAVGVPYAVLLGFAAIFLTIIPYIGATVLCVVAVLISVAQYGDWLHPGLVLLVFAIVQTLEGLVISPKILIRTVSLRSEPRLFCPRIWLQEPVTPRRPAWPVSSSLYTRSRPARPYFRLL